MIYSSLITQIDLLSILFTVLVDLKDGLDGNLNVLVEQEDRKLKSNVKKTRSASASLLPDVSFEVTFVPEIESMCRVEIECVDPNENVLCGNVLKLNARAVDFVIYPFPLLPFPINSTCSFKRKPSFNRYFLY